MSGCLGRLGVRFNSWRATAPESVRFNLKSIVSGIGLGYAQREARLTRIAMVSQIALMS